MMDVVKYWGIGKKNEWQKARAQKGSIGGRAWEHSKMWKK
jgi:hypothetical protein